MMITENIRGQRYYQLIDILAKRCSRFAFVENRQLMENEELRLAPIENLLIERKVQNEWETTTLGEHTAFVFLLSIK
ncbi:hypothetical protein OL548_22445 [Lysinibacillus sp. MHQ-1]|nr:hypothetical protein OL548_22445 [Lysinibacillus sp. MHQ-1]